MLRVLISTVPLTVCSYHVKCVINPILDGHLWGWSRMRRVGGRQKRPLLPKICHTYPTIMELGTLLPCLNKIQKIYESCDTPPDFVLHQHFFTGNQQILLYQEI